MGLFHHRNKDSAPAPSVQAFVVYGFSRWNQADFRREFDHQFGSLPRVTLHFSRPNADIAHRFAAGDATDQFLQVTPSQALNVTEQGRVVDAVHKAAKALGGTMSPVRDHAN